MGWRRSLRMRLGIWGEFWGFLRYNKKWWLAPIILILLILTAILVLGSTAVGPIIYPILW